MSPLQRQLYDFVDAYWREFGFAPTYQAMVMGLELKSRSQIHRMVHSLIRAGYLEMRPGLKRAIRCVPIGTREFQTGYLRGRGAAETDAKEGSMTDTEMQQAMIDRQRVQIDALASVVRYCWEVVREGYDVDGGELQEKLIAVGLLEETEATEVDCEENAILELNPGDSWCRWTELAQSALKETPA